MAMNRLPKTIVSLVALTAGCLALLAVSSDRVDAATKAVAVNVGAALVLVAIWLVKCRGTK